MNKKGPVYEYLNGLRGKWDGAARVRCIDVSWAKQIMTTAATRFLRDRSYMPPYYFYYGPGGSGKTRLLQALAGPFYNDQQPKPSIHKRYGQQLEWPENCLIWEWDGYMGKEETATLLTRIKLQSPWLADCPIVVVTSNTEPVHSQFRHFVLTTPLPIDLNWIDRNRDQLWAEIVAKIPANVHDIPTGGDHGPTSFIESGSQTAGCETVTPAPNPARSEGADQTESAAL